MAYTINNAAKRFTPNFSIGVRKYVEAGPAKREVWMLEVSQHPGCAPFLIQTLITPRDLSDIASWCSEIAKKMRAEIGDEEDPALVRTAPAETSGLITEQNKPTSANAGEK